jgi:putative membrane protein
MKIIVTAMTTFVAVEHIGILVPEMFFWNHPVGQKMFNMTPDASAASAKT